MSLPLNVIRQSAAQILACALIDLFPGIELIRGDVNDIGFSYDFQMEQTFDEHMLPMLEEKMRALIKEDFPVKELTMMRENAVAFFIHHQQNLLAERVKAISDNMVPIFQMGKFYDYCPTPYITRSQEAGAIKLLSISHYPGEKRIRIAGTAFPDAYALKKFLKKLEGYKKHDHRVLGLETQLFGKTPFTGDQLWWLPKGLFIREWVSNRWNEEVEKRGMTLVSTPPILSASLAKKLGHRGKNLLCEIDSSSYLLSASPSLSQAFIYLSQERRVQEFPLRFAEWKKGYEEGKEEGLWGMLRARSFTTDHEVIFCTQEQVVKEIISSLQFIKKTINMFGFEHQWYLRTKAKKTGVNSQQWQESTRWITSALNECEIDYVIDEEKFAYCGPYLEVRFLDAINREWKSSYLSIDLNLPERLELSYFDAADKKVTPIMVTQSLVGSLERFVALLIEKYEGSLPLWLAPEQVKVLPIGEVLEYAESIKSRLTQEGFRVGIDYRKVALGTKVHAAELEKIPYMLIVGDKEEKKSSLSIRATGKNPTNGGTEIEAFLELLKKESCHVAGDRKSFES